MRTIMARLAAAVLIAGLWPARPVAALTAEPWPEADRLFRGDPQWRGADAAYSVALGGGRILWLFGDTFVAPDHPRRAGAQMVHNSVAIQTGADPTRAAMTFYWGGTARKPTAFASAATADHFLWPGPGVRLGERLLLVFMEVAKVDGGLGFATVGTVARLIDNPDDPPPAWRVRDVALPASRHGVAVGAGALLVDGEDLVALSPVEPGAHDVYLIRWPLADVRRGDLSHPRWSPAPVFGQGQTEFSLHRTPSGYAVVSVAGFGGTNVVVRTAPALEGPWSAPQVVCRPAESDRPGILVYAAKGHPALAADGLAVTYCTNHTDFATVIADETLYYPRFLRLRWP